MLKGHLSDKRLHSEYLVTSFGELAGPSQMAAEHAIRRLVSRFAAALRITCAVAAVAAAAVGTGPQIDPVVLVGVLTVLALETIGYGLILVLRPGSAWAGYGDVALVATICVLQGRLLPTATVAQGSSWIAALASTAILGLHMTVPLVAALAGSAVVISGWLAGSVLARASGYGMAHLVTLLIQTAVMPVIMMLLVRAARAADTAMAARERARLAEEIEVARRRDERQVRRRLHDTVLATLTMVASGAIAATGTELLRRRAGQDLGVLAMLEPAPRSTDGTPEVTAGQWALPGVPVLPGGVLPGGVLPGGPTAAPTGMVRLDERIAAAVDRIAPLIAVRLTSVPTTAPAAVVEACVDALNEALINVAKHADVEAATVDLSDDGWQVTVTLRDEGVGFVPDRVARHHYGLRDGVIGRLREIGGWAKVDSAPARGCTVTLGWTRPGR